MRSELINELSSALSKAQIDFKDVEKDKANDFYKKNGIPAKYSSLNAFLVASREALSKNGLCVSQHVQSDEKGYFIESMLMHSSGQYIVSKFYLTLTKQDMQGLGSAITYARKYSYAAIIGLAPDEDDDGNKACGLDDKEKEQKPIVKPIPPPPKQDLKEEFNMNLSHKNQNNNLEFNKEIIAIDNKPINFELIGKLYTYAFKKGINKESVDSEIEKVYGVPTNKLKVYQASEYMKGLK